MAQPLETELAYFAKMKPEWIKSHLGRVALIKGESVVGWFDTEKDAYEAGIGKFDAAPFLIKRVLESDPKFEAPAYTLGLIRATDQ